MSSTRIDTDDDDDFGWPPGFEFPGRFQGCDRWCAPLHLVEKSVEGKPWAKYFDPDDFMIMSRLTDTRGTVTHYKHVDTRCYINVDDFGKTYVYSESDFQRADKRYGYSGCTQLRSAVEQLGLWELPWMREEYFDDRLGLEWDDRWQHPNAPKRTRSW